MKFPIVFAILSVIYAIQASSQEISPEAAVYQAKHKLEKLTSDLSSNELESQIYEEDLKLYGFGETQITNFSAVPKFSECQLRIEGKEPDAIRNSRDLYDAIVRIARYYCLKSFNFNQDERYNSKVGLARDSFTCTITEFTKGTPDQISYSTTGVTGEIYIHRLILPDKRIPINNTQSVPHIEKGQSPSIVLKCAVDPLAFTNGGTMAKIRELWLSEKISAARVALKDAETAVTRDNELRVRLNNELRKEELRLKLLPFEISDLSKKLNKCLSRYRIADRLYRRGQILSAFKKEDRCENLAVSLPETIKQALERADGRVGSTFPTSKLQVNLEAIKQIGPSEKSACEQQVHLCQEPSVMGLATDFVLQKMKE